MNRGQEYIDTAHKTKDSKEDKTIKHISFYSELIETMGYDPQCALLEVKLVNDRQVRQYRNVPEEVWYSLRGNRHPDTYFRRHICGCYVEAVSETIAPEVSEICDIDA